MNNDMTNWHYTSYAYIRSHQRLLRDNMRLLRENV